MKKFLLASAMLVGAAVPASATEVWQGDLFITAASAGCASNGFGVNDFFRAVYRPADIEDNGPDARLSLFGTRVAMRFAVEGPLVGSGDYSGTILFSTGGADSWESTYAGVKIKPASPSVNTKSLTLTIKITQFASFGGCNVTLEGALGNRPNL